MSSPLSARSFADAAFFDKTGELPVQDGKRRIVVMKKGKLTWQIDVGESASDDHARSIAENMNGDNGDGWKFSSIMDRFDHEADNE